MEMTEFADGSRRSRSAFAGLSARTGLPVSHIAELAAADRLGELFDSRGHVGRPLSPQEALRRLEAVKEPPGGFSPAAAKVVLRMRMERWDREAADEARRRRDPHQCLAELRAMRWGWQ
jgi:hypothetical protein